MALYKAKEYQKKILSDTYDGLLDIFIRDAKEYKEALLKSVSETNLKSPKDDDFFRELAFDAFLRISEKDREQTKDAMQQYENMQEVKRLLDADGR